MVPGRGDDLAPLLRSEVAGLAFDLGAIGKGMALLFAFAGALEAQFTLPLNHVASPTFFVAAGLGNAWDWVADWFDPGYPAERLEAQSASLAESFAHWNGASFLEGGMLPEG